LPVNEKSGSTPGTEHSIGHLADIESIARVIHNGAHYELRGAISRAGGTVRRRTLRGRDGGLELSDNLSAECADCLRKKRVGWSPLLLDALKHHGQSRVGGFHDLRKFIRSPFRRGLSLNGLCDAHRPKCNPRCRLIASRPQCALVHSQVMKTSTLRIALAAIVAGAVWFAWGAFAHMVLQLGDSSFKKLPQEDVLLDALRTANPETGLYAFPFWGDHAMGDEAAMKVISEKFAKGPVGIMVYQRSVPELMPPSTLLLEFLGGVIACLFAAAVIVKMQLPPAHAAFAGGMCAIAAWFSHSYSEWLWYAFPLSWVRDALVEQVVGWVLAAWCIGMIVRQRDPRESA
jgi:hypothetical protein